MREKINLENNSIEKRLLKLEKKINTISDNYEEMDNNIEDIYDTINTNKTKDVNIEKKNKI